MRDFANYDDIGKIVRVYDSRDSRSPILGILEDEETIEYNEGTEGYYVENRYKVNNKWYDNILIQGE